MAERSVHEAAKAAGVAALMNRRRDWQGTTGPGFSLQEPDWPQEELAASLVASVVAALVASAEVREGLADVIGGHVCPPSEPCWDGKQARKKAAAILAALAGTEVAG